MPIESPIISIVDDDEMARRSIEALVWSMGLPSKSYESAEAFLDDFNPCRPGCLITDVRMIGMSGIELQEKLIGDQILIPVIIVTAHPETPLTVKAVKQGAVTVLEKPCREDEMVAAIHSALEQDVRYRKGEREKRACQEKLSRLTPSEHSVLKLIVEGRPNKAIARILDLSVRTVESRRQKIFEKTDTRSVAELVRIFVRANDEFTQ